jgi:hypothetical protein
MSIVVAALTPSPWNMWVEVSCIALHHLHLHFEVYLYFYEAINVSFIMLFKFDA